MKMNTNKKLWSALAAVLTTGMLATGARAANPAVVNKLLGEKLGAEC